MPEKYTRWKPGDRAGLSVLVRPVGLSSSNNYPWIVKCPCGALRKAYPSALAYDYATLGRPGTCRACERKRRVKPRHCRSCRTQDPKKFYKDTTLCMACERAGLRNGFCACGRALRKRQGGHPGTVHPTLPCVCKKVSTLETY